MNIQLKQRLVGAVVLVALAVIFIPMLLPGGGDLSGSIDGSNVPPEPDYRFSPISPAPEAPPMAASANLPMDAESVPANAEPVVADKPKAAPVKKPATTPKTTDAKSPAPSPVKEKSPQASGWVVQVGSFSSHQNAQALRDKLRKQGYASFVEETRSASGSVYRVRVGPVVSRTSADQLRKKLLEAAGLKGLVQAYP